MKNEKEYDIGVYQLTFYKMDKETGDALCDSDGNVIEFDCEYDCSYLAESVDIDDLEPINGTKEC